MGTSQIFNPGIYLVVFFAVGIGFARFRFFFKQGTAYGIAVTGTMVLTSILSCTVALKNWHWKPFLVGLLLIGLLFMDIPLFAANATKLFSGGWLPLTLGLGMFIVMTTWKSERFRLMRRMNEHGNSLEAMIASLEKSPP